MPFSRLLRHPGSGSVYSLLPSEEGPPHDRGEVRIRVELSFGFMDKASMWKISVVPVCRCSHNALFLIDSVPV